MEAKKLSTSSVPALVTQVLPVIEAETKATFPIPGVENIGFTDFFSKTIDALRENSLTLNFGLFLRSAANIQVNKVAIPQDQIPLAVDVCTNMITSVLTLLNVQELQKQKINPNIHYQYLLPIPTIDQINAFSGLPASVREMHLKEATAWMVVQEGFLTPFIRNAIAAHTPTKLHVDPTQKAALDRAYYMALTHVIGVLFYILDETPNKHTTHKVTYNYSASTSGNIMPNTDRKINFT